MVVVEAPVPASAAQGVRTAPGQTGGRSRCAGCGGSGICTHGRKAVETPRHSLLRRAHSASLASLLPTSMSHLTDRNQARVRHEFLTGFCPCPPEIADPVGSGCVIETEMW